MWVLKPKEGWWPSGRRTSKKALHALGLSGGPMRASLPAPAATVTVTVGPSAEHTLQV